MSPGRAAAAAAAEIKTRDRNVAPTWWQQMDHCTQQLCKKKNKKKVDTKMDFTH